MTQPAFVPITSADQVRPARHLHVADPWALHRPAELTLPVHPGGRGRGAPGPDQGYALRLARRFEDKIVLQPGESVHDAIYGCASVASRRSSLFGRAPMIFDLDLAFTLWGFMEGAPADLVATRVPAFRAAAHEYEVRHRIADQVPEATLKMAPDDVRSRLDAWRSLLGIS